MLEYVTTLTLLCLLSLAAFVVHALPVWIWPTLLFSLVLSGQLDQFHLQAPANRHEACTWQCEDQYGREANLELSRSTCLHQCWLPGPGDWRR